jgi:hypothetical protein
VCTFVRVKTLLIICLFFICAVGRSQNNDSIPQQIKKDSIRTKHAINKAIYSSARKASILSAVFPGLGQAYNKKYWKMPIIYAAIGGFGYWGITNQKQYKYYSNNLRYENDDNSETLNETGYSSEQLITQKRYYRKFRDMSIMACAFIYLINIVDANVDAHLKTFDVSDDLSLQINPYSNFDYTNKLQAGLTLKLKFK